MLGAGEAAQNPTPAAIANAILRCGRNPAARDSIHARKDSGAARPMIKSKRATRPVAFLSPSLWGKAIALDCAPILLVG